MIITSNQAGEISTNLRKAGKRIVLVGGCFDIIHLGHILFLQKAKAQADILMVMLESDENIKHAKGNDRPYNTQEERAKVLHELRSVDYVILLDKMNDNTAYDTLVKMIQPAIIATTAGDPFDSHKKRQAAMIGCEVTYVIQRIQSHSTSSKVQKLYKNDEL